MTSDAQAYDPRTASQPPAASAKRKAISSAAAAGRRPPAVSDHDGRAAGVFCHRIPAWDLHYSNTATDGRDWDRNRSQSWPHLRAGSPGTLGSTAAATAALEQLCRHAGASAAQHEQHGPPVTRIGTVRTTTMQTRQQTALQAQLPQPPEDAAAAAASPSRQSGLPSSPAPTPSPGSPMAAPSSLASGDDPKTSQVLLLSQLHLASSWPDCREAASTSAPSLLRHGLRPLAYAAGEWASPSLAGQAVEPLPLYSDFRAPILSVSHPSDGPD